MPVCYEPSYARIVGPDGKAIGHSAALMLSQALWLSAESGQADADGWFEWTPSQCEDQTGITPEQQGTARKRLVEAGLLIFKRQGEKGRLHYKVCQEAVSGKTQNSNVLFPGKPKTEVGLNQGKPETGNGVREGFPGNPESGKTQNRENLNQGKPKTEGVPPSSPPPLSPDNLSLFPPIIPPACAGEETLPPYSLPSVVRPPEGEKTKKASVQKIFVPPEPETAQLYIVRDLRGSIADAERFHDHFTANGWRVSGKAPMRDWRAAARNWMRNKTEYAAPRGSPVAQNGHSPPMRERDMGMEEKRAELRRWFSEET